MVLSDITYFFKLLNYVLIIFYPIYIIKVGLFLIPWTVKHCCCTSFSTESIYCTLAKTYSLSLLEHRLPIHCPFVFRIASSNPRLPKYLHPPVHIRISKYVDGSVGSCEWLLCKFLSKPIVNKNIFFCSPIHFLYNPSMCILFFSPGSLMQFF